MKTTNELIASLEAADYPLRFIARQASIPYMKLFRFKRGDYSLTAEEDARVRAFAVVQPCVLGARHDN